MLGCLDQHPDTPTSEHPYSRAISASDATSLGPAAAIPNRPPSSSTISPPAARAGRVLERDADAPRRKAVEVVRGAVERIDHPAAPARAACVRALLAEQAIVRPLAADQVADRRLGLAVGVRNHVGRARLRVE